MTKKKNDATKQDKQNKAGDAGEADDSKQDDARRDQKKTGETRLREKTRGVGIRSHNICILMLWYN